MNEVLLVTKNTKYVVLNFAQHTTNFSATKPQDGHSQLLYVLIALFDMFTLLL